MPYKDPAMKKQKQAEWYQKNKEAVNKKHAEYYQKNRETLIEKQAEYFQENRENITYIITVADHYYIGHTSQGLYARRKAHFYDLRNDAGNLGLQELFDDMGEEAFIKAFDMQVLETFDTREEAILAEKKLLENNIGKPGCLNQQRW